jgi:xylulokinase
MTREPCVLGLDLGTSQVKALLCGPDGRVLGQDMADYSLRTPRAGWAETDPEDWWRAAGVAVRAALAGLPADAEILGLAIAGQMHGVVLAGEEGEALRPAITWLDRRAVAEAAEYSRFPADALAALGNRPSPGMAGPTAAWLSRHEPELFGRARWLLQPKDWLRMRLTGEAAADPTDASGTLLYDMARGRWAADVTAALGLDARLLPPLRPPGSVAGRLRPDAAACLGLPAGLPVATGAADTAASLLAAGLPGPGWGLLTLGTGGQWVVPVAAEAAVTADPSGQTNLFCAADGGAYRLAAAQNVGVTLGWVTTVLRASWADLYGTAARPWQDGTPVFRPYLADERWDSLATGDGGAPDGGRSGVRGGAWEGLALVHGREDLLRAALEGVAFLLRTRLEDLHQAGCRAERVVLAGGGSRDPSWRRLLSDVFGLPLHMASTPWLSARGATLIAGVATGLYDTWSDAARSVPPPQPAIPADGTDGTAAGTAGADGTDGTAAGTAGTDGTAGTAGPEAHYQRFRTC